MYRGFFRPKRSSKGPYNICPADIPIKKLDRDNEIFETVVCKSAAIAGKPGRYMSMEKGPIAERSPNMSISLKFFLFFI